MAERAEELKNRMEGCDGAGGRKERNEDWREKKWMGEKYGIIQEIR
jgi:hypothetical protein